MEGWIRWLEELSEEEYTKFGKKCVNLGKMTRDELPVPPGFAISTECYEYFANEASLPEKIHACLNTLGATDVENIEKTSETIKKIICEQEMPDRLVEEIAKFYNELSEKCQKDNVEVAVRSSGAVSMPGQFESYLCIRGVEDVVEKVIECWASTFTARAIVSRIERGMKVEESPIGVAVLKMVNAKCAGIMFTINPLTEDRSKIIIEGNWGLGESVALGTATPDWIKVNKITLEIEEKKLGNKVVEVVYDRESGGTKEVEVPLERQKKFCVTDEEIRKIALLGKEVERFFGGEPQDIEWAIDMDLPEDKNVLLVQTRPEKTWALKTDKKVVKEKGSALDHIVSLASKGVKVS